MKIRNTYSLHVLACLLLATITLSVAQSRAATLLVSNNNDSGAGSLRQAIQDNLSLGGVNVILFSSAVTGTITLASELKISVNVTIVGPGVNVLKIGGNNSSRVLNVTGGTVSIFDLTLSDGHVVGTNGLTGMNGENVTGAGILNNGTLTLSSCVISNNSVVGGHGGSSSGTGGNGFGGGIGNLGTLNLNQCSLDGNTATGGAGGNSFGTGGQGWGGGLYNGGVVTFLLCSISGNSATAGAGAGGSSPGGGVGAGIYSYSTLSLTNCTVANNTASGGSDSGGGVANFGTLTIRNCTLAGNSADFGGGLSGGGDVGNTILAGNTAGSGPDGSGSMTSSDYNLIQNTSGLTVSGATAHNITGVNPLLGPLQNNGGPTRTMTLLPGSPAIDKGKSFGATTDQRGLLRPYDTGIANASGGDGSDIGAVEINQGTLIVINNNDTGAGSLRQAILDNNGLGGGNTITFSNTVTGAITLLSGELALTNSATILGPGANVLKISGNNGRRVFNITSGTVSISGLSISEGRVVGTNGAAGMNGENVFGGGIRNAATLILTSCVISNNSLVGGQGGAPDGTGGNGSGGGIGNLGTLTLIQCGLDANTTTGGLGGTSPAVGGQGWGGGLYSEGPAILSRCSVSSNSALAGAGGGGPGGGLGGGIFSYSTLNLTNCTVAGNSATGSSFDFGGGIENNGTLTIRNSTIAGNQADFGGGIDGGGNLGNTILAGNTAGSGPDASGPINSSDYNLIQSISGATLSGTTTHVIVGQDPLLGPLADNGGLSRTLALRFGSPAIDKGNSFGAPTDQRGAPRPFDFAAVSNAGDGSDIGAFELGTPLLSVAPSAPNVVLAWPAYYGDFALEAEAALSTANSWTTVPNTRVVVGDRFNVTDNAATGNKFYRLKSR